MFRLAKVPSSLSLVLTLAFSVSVFSQNTTAVAPSRAFDKDDWTNVASSMPPEPLNQNDRALRNERNAAFDDRTGTKRPLDSRATNDRTGHGMSILPVAIPPLPSQQSTAVIIGMVTEFQPYLSSDRTSIYTELTVTVERIFKDSEQIVGNRLIILNLGGAIKLSDGRVVRQFVIPTENHIKVGRRYVLFLNYYPKTASFAIVKAWQLDEGRAVPLAYSDIKEASQASQAQSSKYAGMTEAEFLAAVQESVGAPK